MCLDISILTKSIIGWREYGDRKSEKGGRIPCR
jgi:hypothetical protein